MLKASGDKFPSYDTIHEAKDQFFWSLGIALSVRNNVLALVDNLILISLIYCFISIL